MKSATLILTVLTLFIGGIGQSQADMILDQSVPYYNDGTSINSETALAQTFTVGVSGTLSAINLSLWQIDATSPLNIYVVHPNSNGVPPTNTNSALGSFSLPASSVPFNPGTFTTVNVLSSDIPVTAGEQLAIILQNNVIGNGYFFDYGTSYSGGSGFGTDSPNPPFDWIGTGGPPNTSPTFSFQTYVAVPEPSSFILLGVVVVFGFIAYRRRRRTVPA